MAKPKRDARRANESATAPPAETLTFFFSDMEGATAVLARLGDDAYAELLIQQRSLLRSVWHRHNGTEKATEGDSFFVVFHSAAEAVAAAVEAQLAIKAKQWPKNEQVRLRMGLHTGEPVDDHDDGYVGIDVHTAARIAALGHGGQVLLSDTTRQLVKRRLPPSAQLRDLGSHPLRGIPTPERLFQLDYGEPSEQFPPLRTEATTGSSGTDERLAELLTKIRECNGKELQFVTIGGLYLDLRVYPVDLAEFKEGEWASLDPVEAHLGGSAYFLGKYLSAYEKVLPRIISVVGNDDDPLSTLANTMINSESWIQELPLSRRALPTPLSIHMTDSKRQRTSTFTHRGALDDFNWQDIHAGLKRIRDCPSVLIITGFFRTQLHQGLEKNLEVLSQRHLIAVDHGRWVAEDVVQTATTALRTAFEDDFIDIYLCSPDELFKFAAPPGAELEATGSTQDRLRLVAERVPLPAITVVRERSWHKGIPRGAYVMMDRDVRWVELDAQVRKRRGRSPKNAFDAAFLYHLVDSNDDSLQRRTVNAVRQALEVWVRES